MGGLETFTQLLTALLADTGMGFVLVQHVADVGERIRSKDLEGTRILKRRESWGTPWGMWAGGGPARLRRVVGRPLDRKGTASCHPYEVRCRSK